MAGATNHANFSCLCLKFISILELQKNMSKNKYSDLKFLGFPETLNALRKIKIMPPVHLRIKPTNICNHDCWYCAYHASGLQLGDQMTYRDVIPFEKLNEVANDIVEMGVSAVTFSGGGEPLLYKRLPEIIEKSYKGGVKVATLTNGSNLKGLMAEAFQKYGTWVRVSLDGYDDDSYAKARGVKSGEFTNLMNNMRAFKSSNTNCILGCSFIVGKDNCKHVFNICEKLKGVGVDHVKISGAVVGNSPEENNLYHGEIKSIVGKQIQMAIKLSDDNFKIVDHYHDLEGRFKKEYTTCPYILYRPVIGADSCVYTCQDKAYTDSGKLGSIKNQSFKDYWHSQGNLDAVYGLDPSKSCNHHCISHSKNVVISEYLSIDQDHLAFT